MRCLDARVIRRMIRSRKLPKSYNSEGIASHMASCPRCEAAFVLGMNRMIAPYDHRLREFLVTGERMPRN